MKSVQIVGLGSYLPGPSLTNDDLVSHLAKYFGSSLCEFGKYYAGMMGFSRRHWARDLETGKLTEKNSDISTKAAAKALEHARIDANDIDVIIVSTATPDFLSPPTAVWVQDNLNIRECAIFEVRSSCAGIGQALSIATQFIKSGVYKTALVIGSELHSMLIQFDKSDYSKQDVFNSFMFGDGAGAVVLKGSDEEGRGIIGFSNHSFGVGKTPGIAFSHMDLDSKGIKPTIPRIDQDFNNVKNMVQTLVKNSLEGILKATGFKPDDVDRIILPAGNIQMVEETCPEIRPFHGKILNLTDRIGITTNGSIYIILDEYSRQGVFKENELMILLNMDGSKWFCSSIALRW